MHSPLCGSCAFLHGAREAPISLREAGSDVRSLCIFRTGHLASGFSTRHSEVSPFLVGRASFSLSDLFVEFGLTGPHECSQHSPTVSGLLTIDLSPWPWYWLLSHGVQPFEFDCDASPAKDHHNHANAGSITKVLVDGFVEATASTLLCSTGASEIVG